MVAAGEKPLRVGVLGTGYWARWCHATVLAGRPDIDFVGFWGRDPQKAVRAAQEIGGRGFDDVDLLLGSVDAVAAALPPHVQAPLAARAARAGKHILLDKPLALDLREADNVVAAVEESGVATVSFMTYLFQAEVRGWLKRMKELAAEHGGWEGASVHCFGSIELPGSPYADSTWRHERGGLWDWGPHALSLVQELLPAIERVSVTKGVRDTVDVELKHTGGPGSVLILTVTAPERAIGAWITVWGPGGRHELALPSGTLREAYGRAVDDFRDCVRSGQPHPLDAQYARNIVAVLAAAEQHLGHPAADRTTGIVKSGPDLSRRTDGHEG
jgi:predicted dehydrogenase